jgi:MFS transporter, DHA1 family, multidrug resistance protein
MMPKRLSYPEFVAMIAAMFAILAFSIDSMLPALPQIAAELTPDAPNAAQLIITSFVFGMGFGTLLAGPLSDAFGRRPVIFAGVALYAVGAVAAWAAPTLETLLAARLVQGLGAAAPRVVSLAITRDLYQGRQMAKIMSFVMMVFTIVPALAPFIGQYIIAAAGWRSVFLAFLVFASFAMLWFGLRQAETLPERRPLTGARLVNGIREVLSHRVIRLSILAQVFIQACLFGTLSSTQPILDVIYGRADEFPMWFAVIAVCSSSGSFVNAALVVRLGMRRMVVSVLIGQVVASGLMLALTLSGGIPPGLAFPLHLIWTISVFFMIGLTMGNLNALAMEPVGHIAGMAASVMGALSTVVAVPVAAVIGLMFDGTALPLIASVAVLALLALVTVKAMGPR